MPIDFDSARQLLDSLFVEAEQALLSGNGPKIPEDVRPPLMRVFQSNSQSIREALLGCAVARYQDPQINIRLAYVNLGENAFNGRSLDEIVINPFLHAHKIPASKGPYLAMFRRSVRFDESMRAGVRDKQAFDDFLYLLGHIEGVASGEELKQFLFVQLYEFAKIREAAQVAIARLSRISLEQFDSLLTCLLAAPSGGRIPVMLVRAVFETLNAYFDRHWTIDAQAINEADAPTGASGDITVRDGERIVFAAEVTERPLDSHRVATTFNTKISPQGIGEYLFFIKPGALASDARVLAQQYFAQGHEVNFLEIKNWATTLLASMGTQGREIFNQRLLLAFDDEETPRTLKVAWNRCIAALVRPA